MKLSIDSKHIMRILFGALLVLFLGNLCVQLLRAYTTHGYLYGIAPLLNFYDEGNLPTWFSTILLFASSSLLLLIHFTQPNSQKTWHWLVLSGVFLFLSVDELAQIHEKIGAALSKANLSNFTNTSGGFAWILWGGALTLIVAFVFAKFWFNLSPRIRLLVAIAAIAYVGGSLGLEIVELLYRHNRGPDLVMRALVTTEETLEMLGLMIFIKALLEQLALQAKKIELLFDSK